jgi:hypothetical protein
LPPSGKELRFRFDKLSGDIRTSSKTILPPGFKTLYASFNTELLPFVGNRLITQLEIMQLTESDAIGRGSVRSVLTKETWGG